MIKLRICTIAVLAMFLLFRAGDVKAQLSEDFSSVAWPYAGWVGNTSDFSTATHTLQLSAQTAATSQYVAKSYSFPAADLAYPVMFEFEILTPAPSSNNYTLVYLWADSSDCDEAENAIFVTFTTSSGAAKTMLLCERVNGNNTMVLQSDTAVGYEKLDVKIIKGSATTTMFLKVSDRTSGNLLRTDTVSTSHTWSSNINLAHTGYFGYEITHSATYWNRFYLDNINFRAMTPGSTTTAITATTSNAQHGTVSVNGRDFHHGDTAILEASPNTGYLFDHWQDNDTSNPRIIIADTAVIYPNFVAYFVGDTVTLEVLSSDTNLGTYYGGGSYLSGKNITITAVPFMNVAFTGWSDGDTINPRHIVLTSDMNVTANFRRISSSPATNFNLHVSSADNTMGVGAGNGTFPEGCRVEISAIPIEGYRFARWNDGNTNNPRTVVVNSDSSFVAIFEANMTSVSDADMTSFTVSTSQNTITVTGAENQRVRLLDNVGRILFTEQNTSAVKTFTVPACGTYLIQVANQPARKVIVAK